MQNYKSARELFLALLDGKKVRQKSWHKDSFIQFNGNNVVTDTNGIVVTFSFGHNDWEEYLSPEEHWDWKAGDCFEYKINTHSYGTYKILFVNDEVCYCENLNNPGYCEFYNTPDLNKMMHKI